jgi:hypothetical protein
VTRAPVCGSLVVGNGYNAGPSHRCRTVQWIGIIPSSLTIATQRNNLKNSTMSPSSPKKTTNTLLAAAASKVTQSLVKERDARFSKQDASANDTILTSRRRRKSDPVEGIVKLAAAGIRLVSEAVMYRRAKKELRKGEDSAGSEGDALNGRAAGNDINAGLGINDKAEQRDEAIRTLDDAKQEYDHTDPQRTSPDDPTPVLPPESKKETSTTIASAFIARHTSTPSPQTPTLQDPDALPSPILLPQKRPSTRSRGFLLAHPPPSHLSALNITAATFLDFITSFNKSLEPNPYLHAINLAGFAGSAVPEPAGMLLGVGVELATEAALEASSRVGGNRFLEEVNREFWAPRGVVAKVVTWSEGDMGDGGDGGGGIALAEGQKGNEGVTRMPRDIALRKTTSSNGLAQIQAHMQRMLRPSEFTLSSSETPSIAPLIFPSPTAAHPLHSNQDAQENKKKKKNAVGRAEIWLDEYLDKRAQATWKMETDGVASEGVPYPKFRSRYADPKHLAGSGDIVGLITGGKWWLGEKSGNEVRGEQVSVEDKTKEKKTEAKKRDIPYDNKSKRDDESEKANENGDGDVNKTDTCHASSGRSERKEKEIEKVEKEKKKKKKEMEKKQEKEKEKKEDKEERDLREQKDEARALQRKAEKARKFPVSSLLHQVSIFSLKYQ